MSVLIAAALALTPNPAPASPPEPPALAPQAGVTLDLGEALRRARATSPRLRAAQARLDERRAAVTVTRADALPQLTLERDVTRSRDASAAWNGGGSLPAQAAALAAQTVPASTFTLQAKLAQPLFHGGQLAWAVQAARLGTGVAQAEARTQELDVLHEAAQAYVAVLGARAALDVASARLEVATRFRTDMDAKRGVQMATELDRLRAEAECQAAWSERIKTQAALLRAQETLRSLLGLEPGCPLELQPLGAPPAADPGAAVPRSEVVGMERQEEALRLGERIAKAERRPKLDLAAGYGYQAPRNPQLFKAPFEAWNVSLSLRLPLFDGLRTRGKVAQQQAQREQVHQSRLDLQRSIDLERNHAGLELQSATAYQASAELSHRAAEEALRTSQASFAEGLITSLDLLSAQREERQRESERRSAALAVWSAALALRRAQGLPPT